MPPLHYVAQPPNSTGCGIACAAMIAGVSYNAMVARYRAEWPEERGFRTHVENLRHLLRRKRHRIGPRRKTKDLSRLKQPALVATRLERNGNWHWIIVDPRTAPGTVFDPLSARGRAYQRDLTTIKAAWYHTLRGVAANTGRRR
jgi:hypothetical protein